MTLVRPFVVADHLGGTMASKDLKAEGCGGLLSF